MIIQSLFLEQELLLSITILLPRLILTLLLPFFLQLKYYWKTCLKKTSEVIFDEVVERHTLVLVAVHPKLEYRMVRDFFSKYGKSMMLIQCSWTTNSSSLSSERHTFQQLQLALQDDFLSKSKYTIKYRKVLSSERFSLGQRNFSALILI